MVTHARLHAHKVRRLRNSENIDWKYFAKNTQKPTGLQLVVLNNSQRGMNSTHEETHMFDVLRDALLPLRQSEISTIGVIMFFHDAHEMLINAQRRARAAKNNPSYDEKYERWYGYNSGRSRRVSPYRFAVNSRISSLVDFTTAGKVSRTSSKWESRRAGRC